MIFQLIPELVVHWALCVLFVDLIIIFTCFRQGVDLLRPRMLLELEQFPLAVLQMWLLVLDTEELLEDREHQTGGVFCLLSLIVVGMK